MKNEEPYTMKDCLKRFVNTGLFEASLSLLDELGIQYTKGATQAINARQLSTDKLSKAADAALDLVLGTWFVAQIDDRTFQQKPDSVSLASALSDADRERYNGLFVFAVEVKPDANLTRTVAATLTRVFNRIAKAQPVILFIRQGHELSLSTCERSEYTQQWRSGEKLGKVSILRNINCENAHRGHINLLSRMSGGATNFDELYKNWMTIFDIKLLSKQFYNELFEWYEWVMQLVQQGIVRFPAYPKDGYGNESKDETIIRIITRMLFVWFIKEKGLISEKLFNKNQIKQLVKGFDPNSLSAHNYYNAILQNLFFATLNCEKDERCFIPESKPNGTNPGYGVNNLYRGDDLLKIDKENFMSIFDSIPYLNGGLFERLDTKGNYFDGFSKEPNRRAIVPDVLFFGKEENNHIGLLSLFEKYVFTVEENTPLEQNVSLDPELLGRVFENLLGAYNPETDTTARKASGSYYTPREIVEYMVNESLVQHIIKHGVAESTVRDLLEYKETDTHGVSIDERSSIMKALYHIKVLDPACGSGAFPMGMLQQMVHILRQIDPDNSAWKDFLKRTAGEQADKAYRESDDQEERQLRLEQIEKAFNLRYANPDYARKLFIIQNCIYGVDIQPIAMQISKLRFFISLICEQNNGNILPLPNLETKFVCANTLISVEKGDGLLLSEELEIKKKELLEVRKQHFYSRTSKEKREYRKKDDVLRKELENIIADIDGFNTDSAKQLTSWNPYDQNASSPFFDPEWMFGIGDGFDVVIGNPPYVLIQTLNNNTLENKYKKIYSVASYKVDLFHLFIEQGYNLLNNYGILTYINPTTFLTNNYTQPLRDLLLKKTRIIGIINIIDNVFNASVNTGIEILQKDIAIDNSLYYYYADLIDSKLSVNLISSIKQIEYLKAEKHIIQPLELNDKFSLIQKIERKADILKKHASVNFGMQLRNRKIFSNDVVISHNPESLTTYHRKCLTGKDISKYITKWQNRYCYFNEEARCGGCWDENVHNAKNKILVRQVGAFPICGIDKAGYAVLNSAFMIVCKDFNPFGVLGIINSKLIHFYWSQKFEDKRKTFPKIKGTYLELLPILAPNDEIIILTNTIIKALEEDPQADTSAWEAEIDFLVYKLYGLSYDEVLVVDPETGITREEYERV